MNRSLASLSVLILIVAGAAAIRLVRLDNRPMHTDEAVHGLKFGDVLDGTYKYDPVEYHGPSLNYLTIPVVRMGGGNSLAQTTEVHLRLVPAICGILIIAGLWLVRDGIGRGAMLCAAVLAAASPAMIFYSRYYIQEMLLVCFTFFVIAALWRSGGLRTPSRIAWLVVAGLSAGLMHATKETCIIAFFAMVVAGVGVAVFSLCAGNGWTKRKVISLAVSGSIVLGVGAVVSVILFSSMFSDFGAVADSITTFGNYFTQADGQGSAGAHIYPWYHYLRIVTWWRVGDGVLWTEALVVVLAVVGLIAGMLGRGCGKASIPLVRFVCIYTLVMIGVYSVISYKTPWCLLGFFHGMILLAGIGAAVLLRIARPVGLKAIVAVVLVVATGHLAWQGWRGSFPRCADPGNPYVYSHTTEDAPELARLVRELSKLHPKKNQMPVQITCPGGNPWPFPWYLRDFTRVDWYGKAKEQPAVLIHSADSILIQLLRLPPPPYAELNPETKAGEKSTGFWELRPNVFLGARVEPELLKQYNASQADGAK